MRKYLKIAILALLLIASVGANAEKVTRQQGLEEASKFFQLATSSKKALSQSSLTKEKDLCDYYIFNREEEVSL